MKIGFLISNYNSRGGTERVTSILANELVKQNYQVSIVSFNEGLIPTFKTDQHVRLYSVGNEKRHNRIVKKLANFATLRKIISQINLDILVVVDTRLYVYAYLLQKLNYCKVIVWEQFNYYAFNDEKVRRFTRKLAGQHANYLVTLSKTDLNNYKSNISHLVPAVSIYNPLTLNFNKQSNVNNKKVIAVGRLEKQKGFDLLLKAWQKVEKQINDWELNIYGQGIEKENLLQEIKLLHLKNAYLRGFTSNIHDKYLESSIYVLSSRFEGFGLVLTEALASGLPCISFDITGPNEIIQNNINGFLVEKDNVNKLANKIIELIKNKTEREQLSKNAIESVKRFDLTNIINDWENIFNFLMTK